jgi:aminocarboxymuconate-semialdehyde decarboxylase
MAQESLPGQEHPVLDAHAHALIPAIEAAVAGQPGAEEARALGLRRDGAPSAAVTRQMVAERIPALTDPATRLADMDAAGVDVQLVSPSPGHYHYWADPGLAREVTQAAGEGIAALVARHPDRLLGLGLVPLQHPADCQAALEHAVTGCGLAGVEISSHAGQPGATVELSDERLDPFWARAAELGAIVFLHPFGCSLDERLDRFYLSNTVGQPVEHAVALSHLIFGGVLDRHPGLRVLAAHGGGYLPGYLGRSDHAWQVRPEARGCAQPPSSYLRRIWFDSLVHDPAALRALVAAAGPGQVLLGSDYPFDMGVTDPVRRLLDAGLDADATAAIAGGNAARLGLRCG